jgi:excisionase family DNA binding protein
MDRRSTLGAGLTRNPDGRQTLGRIGEAGLLKPGEVALLLSVSRSWLYQAASDGRVPSVRLGGPEGPLRFIEEELMQWLDRGRSGRAQRT